MTTPADAAKASPATAIAARPTGENESATGPRAAGDVTLMSLQTGDIAERRRVVLSATEQGVQTIPLLDVALTDDSPLVRRAAVRSLARLGPPARRSLEAALKTDDPIVRRAALVALVGNPGADNVTYLADGDPLVRSQAVRYLVTIVPRDARIDGLLDAASRDSCDTVKGVAMAALDPEEKPFEGVDENAWVWMNGVFVGAHAIGPSGWNKPFRLDITREVRWGAANCIVVRAMNTKGAGGIWRPGTLEALSLK